MEKFKCLDCGTKFIIVETQEHEIDSVIFCPNCAETKYIELLEYDLDD